MQVCCFVFTQVVNSVWVWKFCQRKCDFLRLPAGNVVTDVEEFKKPVLWNDISNLKRIVYLCIGAIIDRRIVSLGLYALRCVDIKRKRYAYLVVRKPEKLSKRGTRNGIVVSTHKRGLLFSHLYLRFSQDLLTTAWHISSTLPFFYNGSCGSWRAHKS